MNDVKIKEIVKEIVFDIEDRRGLKNAWDSIDEDIKDEIKEEWLSIIKSKISQ